MKFEQTPSPLTALSKRLRKLAVYGTVLGLLIGTVYFAPASWLGIYLERISEGKLSLVQTSGTLWGGSGSLLIKANTRRSQSQASSDVSNPSASTTTTTTITTTHTNSPELLIAPAFSWHISLGTSVDGFGITLSLANPCCLRAPLTLSVSPLWKLARLANLDASSSSSGSANPSSDPSGLLLRVSDFDSEWPAQWLGALGAPWNTVAPKGTLILQTHEASLLLHPLSGDQPQLGGLVQLTLKDLSSQLSTLDPLGTYAVKLSNPGKSAGLGGSGAATDGVTLHLSLETLEGRLELTGEGEWVNQHLHFNGMAKAQTGFEAALANLLSVLGPRNDNTATLKIG